MADLFRKTVIQEQILKERDLQLFNFVKQCFATKENDGKNFVELSDPVYNQTVSSVEAALRMKYERRLELLHCGFFTPIAKPYRSLGTVILDNQDLFASYINSDEQQQLKKIMEKKFEEKPIQKIVEEKQEQDNKHIDSGKYTESGTLPLIDERLKSARRYSRRKTIDEPELYSTLRSKAKRINECGLLLQHIPKDFDNEDQLKSIYARRREHTIEKLRTIYSLLCGVVNMKCKDLKRFMPLPTNYVKVLMKEPQEGTSPFALGTSQLRRIHHQKKTKCYPMVPTVPKNLKTPEFSWKTFIYNENRSPNSDTCNGTLKSQSSAEPSLKSDLKETEVAVFELPPWLALIQAKNTTEQRFRQKLRESKDTIQTLKVTFANLQKTMAKMTQRRLLLKRDSRTIRMSAVLQLLDISPDVHFGTMIKSIDQDTKGLEPPKHPPLWFTLLKNECLELDTQEETNPLLQKLTSFHHFTANSIPSAEEKLCLLAVSLKADQLLRLAVQDALLFIVRTIFKCSAKHVKQWFLYRKLPFTLICQQ
uniref:uncharacterized protein isoform X2 n=1 Tax=Pristiophorus japonicus TaxID=55135 RepID=UPI00398F8339